MVTRLSFAGTTSGIGGRVPPRKVACSVTISLQENRDLPHSVTVTFEVHQMDLVNGYPYFFLRRIMYGRSVVEWLFLVEKGSTTKTKRQMNIIRDGLKEDNA